MRVKLKIFMTIDKGTISVAVPSIVQQIQRRTGLLKRSYLNEFDQVYSNFDLPHMKWQTMFLVSYALYPIVDKLNELSLTQSL